MPEYAVIIAFIALAIGGVIATSPPSGLFDRIETKLALAGDARNDASDSPAPPTSQPESPSMRLRAAWATIAIASAALFAGVFIRWLHVERRLRQVPGAANDSEKLPDALQSRIYAKRQAIYTLLDSDNTILLDTGLEVGHLLTTMPFFVSPGATRQEVCDLMKQRKIRHLLVGSASDLVGVISDRDPGLRSGETAREIMTPNPLNVPSSMPISQAISTLLTHGFSCLPVVCDGRVVGILTTTDLVLTLQCALRVLEQLRKLVRENIGMALPNAETTREQPRTEQLIA